MANRLDERPKSCINANEEYAGHNISECGVISECLERITMLETKAQLSEKDLTQAVDLLTNYLEKNTEFRIKWPRGEMGSLPADSDSLC